MPPLTRSVLLQSRTINPPLLPDPSSIFTCSSQQSQKMDRYQRVAKQKDETEIAENEIRINSTGRTRNYITYAMSLLQVQRELPKAYENGIKKSKHVLLPFLFVQHSSGICKCCGIWNEIIQ